MKAIANKRGPNRPDPGAGLALLAELAEVVETIGTPRFYDTLAKGLASFLDSQRYLAIRYSKFAKPEFLANRAMTVRAEQSYLKTFYRIDPVLRMIRDGNTADVITFDALKKNGSDGLFYDEMYRTADIRDELVFLLPTVGGVWVAICIDRSTRHFSSRETEQAKLVYPTFKALHALHINQCLFGRLGGYLNDSQISLMVADADNSPQFRNRNWVQQIDSELENRIFKKLAGEPDGSEAISAQQMCHWEKLDLKNAVAPGGTAIVIEEISPGYIDLSSIDLIARFAKNHSLTPRELQIVGQIIRGEPASRIAESLNVSVGTIRNHKHRLYYKLDITTERELFCMVFFDFFD